MQKTWNISLNSLPEFEVWEKKSIALKFCIKAMHKNKAQNRQIEEEVENDCIA
jgi:Zn ribbon nucleic-acid-binding protein